MGETVTDSGKRVPFWLWPNVIGIDAPLVAVAWQYFFAEAFRIKLPSISYLTLGLVVWVIYSADHLLDAKRLVRVDSAAPRHRFYQRYFIVLAGITVLAAALAGFLILTTLPENLVRFATLVGMFVAVHFVHRLWARGLMLVVIPKEVYTGAVFAIGATLVGHAASNDIPEALWSIEVIGLGLLCSLNCLAISVWERESDADNDPNAIAQLLPEIKDKLVSLAAALTAVLVGLAVWQRESPGFPLLAGCAVGALLLTALAIAADRLGGSALRMLADLAVLLPALVLLPLTPWVST